MRQRDWIDGLPRDSRFDAITWVEQDGVGTAVTIDEQGVRYRFQPVGEEWYDEIHCSLERGVSTLPLLRAAIPEPSNAAAVEAARRQAVASSSQTAAVLCTGIRYLVAAEDANIQPNILGAIAVGLALEHRYEYTHQAAITDVSRLESVSASDLRSEWRSAVRAIGTTNLLRIATTDAYHDTRILPRPVLLSESL